MFPTNPTVTATARRRLRGCIGCKCAQR